MKQNTWEEALLATYLLLIAAVGNAAEITLNGFASFVGGRAFNQVELPGGNESTYLADPVHALNDGIVNDDARYGEELTYRPDSNYGLQINAILGRGLKATAQLTGKGSNDFEAEIEWAYLSYDLSNKVTLQAGRQRIPVYFYSDFLDVGYAYHWIRPPVEVYGSTMSTYEGLSVSYQGSLGDWDTGARVYSGTIISEESRFGEFGSDEMVGLVLTTSNEWVRLRASGLRGDFFVKDSTTDEEDPAAAYFSSLGAYFTLGDGFIAAETTYAETLDEYIDTIESQAQIESLQSYMVSAGYQLGEFTPHISYAEVDLNLSGALEAFFDGLSSTTETITVGLRWDFHPSAAFKLEYATSTDGSSSELIAIQGKVNEVDVVTFGFDIIF